MNQTLSGWEKFKLKFAEAPLVPLDGKDKATQQRYMRARVAAQGFTLACLFYFSFYNTSAANPSLEQKIIQHHNSLGTKGNPLLQDKKPE
ncbi:hypothetical protein BASA81_002249 [Batrachochytrium salamandrivorans]|nr:hypothetical protein BASA81_002249 [Batrachochytrium salamandrivorans]